MDELEEKISREIQILNAERQYMKELSADVEVGKFGGRVSAPPTRSSQSSGYSKNREEQDRLTQLKLLH